MAVSDQQRAKELAQRWGLVVRHALYRRTGTWYHRLRQFPGALLDEHGYVIFESEEAFNACPQLQVRKQVSAPKGIKRIPGYVYASTAGDQPDRMLVESLVRPRSATAGQGWAGSAEGRRAVEAYAMRLAKSHYQALWAEVLDVSGSQPFDLLCRDGDRELRVEVKGTTTPGFSILLTRNEVRHARAHDGRMALFLVSEIMVDPLAGCSGGVT
jgi:hypothetical protein